MGNYIRKSDGKYKSAKLDSNIKSDNPLAAVFALAAKKRAEEAAKAKGEKENIDEEP